MHQMTEFNNTAVSIKSHISMISRGFPDALDHYDIDLDLNLVV